MLSSRRRAALAVACAVLATLTPRADHKGDIARAQPSGGTVPADVYEPDDSPEQAHPLLLVGLPQQRTFHSPTDTDWVYFDVDAGERVGVATTGTVCDTFITLYAPDGRTILGQDDDSGGGSNAAIRFTSPVDATYFVEVRQFGRPTSPCGPYELVGMILPPPEADSLEPDNTAAQAKPLPTDGTLQQHSFHVPGDQDWVTLTVEANSALRIATTGDCDTVLTLYAPDGQTQLAKDDDSGRNGNSIVVYTFTQAGTYYAKVENYDPDTGVCDAYALSATPVPPSLPDRYEPDDTPSQAKPLALDGTPQERSLHNPDDLDWVTLTLNANDRILLWTSGPCDTYLYFVAPDGRTVIDEDDDSGESANAAIIASVTQSGAYYGVVRPYGGSTPTCPSYQLQAILLPPAHPGTPGPGVTTTPLPTTGTPTPTSGFPRLSPTPRTTPTSTPAGR